MKAHFSDFVPKIKQFSQRLDDYTFLKDHQWVMINDIFVTKTTYIFRSNNELLISENGMVSRARWEYLNHRSLLIENSQGTFLVNQTFQNEETLILNIDGSENYSFFINESKFETRINNILDLQRYLEKRYLKGLYVSSYSKYYYVERAREYGPYTFDYIKVKVRNGELNSMCFVRDQNEKNYERGLRIKDLMNHQ